MKAQMAFKNGQMKAIHEKLKTELPLSSTIRFDCFKRSLS